MCFLAAFGWVGFWIWLWSIGLTGFGGLLGWGLAVGWFSWVSCCGIRLLAVAVDLGVLGWGVFAGLVQYTFLGFVCGVRLTWFIYDWRLGCGFDDFVVFAGWRLGFWLGYLLDGGFSWLAALDADCGVV